MIKKWIFCCYVLQLARRYRKNSGVELTCFTVDLHGLKLLWRSLFPNMTSTPESCDFLPNTSDLLQVSATYTYTWHDDEEEEEEDDDRRRRHHCRQNACILYRCLCCSLPTKARFTCPLPAVLRCRKQTDGFPGWVSPLPLYHKKTSDVAENLVMIYQTCLQGKW